MCGRFTLNSTSEALAAEFELDDIAFLQPRFNIAPSQDIAVIRSNDAGSRECVELRWGLIPSWAKDPTMARAPINARCETAAEKPTFRRAMSRSRCLVPASGFYEWQTTGGKGAKKQPYLFHRAAHATFAMAGLYEAWHGEGGEIIESVALLTTEANEVVAPVHKRMPVILASSNYVRWLDRENHDAASVADLLVPLAADVLAARPVSSQVNSPHFDEAACIEPLVMESSVDDGVFRLEG